MFSGKIANWSALGYVAVTKERKHTSFLKIMFGFFGIKGTFCILATKLDQTVFGEKLREMEDLKDLAELGDVLFLRTPLNTPVKEVSERHSYWKKSGCVSNWKRL